MKTNFILAPLLIFRLLTVFSRVAGKKIIISVLKALSLVELLPLRYTSATKASISLTPGIGILLMVLQVPNKILTKHLGVKFRLKYEQCYL